MDKLLTIKEAAAFLNVSQMSLRRWTNSGSLKCYRVGGKNERRFEMQELQNFLSRDNSRLPLGINDLTVKKSDHITHFYKKIEECLDEGISYLAKGLSLGDHLLVISTYTRLPKILEGLERFGFQISKLLGNGTIVTSTGVPDIANQLQFMNKAIESIQAPKSFRLLGDMVWALEQGWSLNDINILENHTNQFFIRNNALLLCQYDLTRFGADAAMMALETHNITVHRGQLKESPYFIGAPNHNVGNTYV